MVQNSGNISSASLQNETIPIADAEILYRELDGQFYFNVTTGAWNWKDMSDNTADMIRETILSKLTPDTPVKHVDPEEGGKDDGIREVGKTPRARSSGSSKVPMNIRYRKHIETICKINDITINISPGSAGRSWTKNRIIRIPEIKTGITYAISLHEIGHILSNHSGRRLEKEVQAWEWAMKNAIEWTQPMNQAMERRLGSYLRWCQRRKGAWVPPADHPAWRMANIQPLKQ